MSNKTKVLIVVDMQKDFIDGSLGTKEAQTILPNVLNKVREYVLNKDKIIFTKDTHNENYLKTNEGKHLPVKHCIIGTEGYLINPELINAIDETSSCYVLNKPTFGHIDWKHDFDNFDIMTEDETKLEIELCGLCTDICVISNALILKALYPEATIKVDSSCCAGVTPEKHNAALEVMKSCQIEVI